MVLVGVELVTLVSEPDALTNIHVLEKAGMITRKNAWFANQEPIYLSCIKVVVI